MTTTRFFYSYYGLPKNRCLTPLCLPFLSALQSYMICNWKLVVAKKVRYIFFLSYVNEIVITLGSCKENGKLIQL